MATQDNVREMIMIKALDLKYDNRRMGPDAFDDFGRSFELKSSIRKKGEFSMNHGSTRSIIERWRRVQWVFAFMSENSSKEGFFINSMWYMPPHIMTDIFDEEERKLDIIDRKREMENKFWDSLPDSEEKRYQIAGRKIQSRTDIDLKMNRSFIEINGLILARPYGKSLQNLLLTKGFEIPEKISVPKRSIYNFSERSWDNPMYHD